MLVSNTYYASQLLAIGVASYCATLFFKYSMTRNRYFGGSQDIRGMPAVVRFGKFYNYWLFLPLSTLGLLGASMLVARDFLPAPNTHFSNADTSILKYHIGVPIATGVLSFVYAALLILPDDEQSGPAAAVCGIASGVFGLAAPLAFQMIGKVFSNNSDILMTEVACLSLAPMVLLLVLWGRSGASD